MNISPIAQKRRLLQGSINLEHINYVKPAIFEVNKQINQPSLGQPSSSFSPSKAASSSQPYFLQHNHLLFHSPTSKLSLQKNESMNEAVESCKQDRADFASYVKVKYEETQKKRLGQSLLANPSLPCLPASSNNGTQPNDKPSTSKKAISNKKIILGIHTKRSDLIQPKETNESGFAANTTALNDSLSKNQAEMRFHHNFFQAPKQGEGQYNNLKTLFQPILSNRESESKVSEAYQLTQDLEQRYQGELCLNKSSSQSLEKNPKSIQGIHKMTILSRKIKNSENQSNQQQDWFMGSQTMNRRNISQPRESDLLEQHKKQNQKKNLNISASLPALQINPQSSLSNNEINYYDKHSMLKMELAPSQDNGSEYELENVKTSPRSTQWGQQNDGKDKLLLSQTVSSKWRVKNDRHSNINKRNLVATERLDQNTHGLLYASPSKESLLQFQRASIQQETTIQQRFEQNKIFDYQPKKQISLITPPHTTNSAKQTIPTHLNCFTEDNTPNNNQLNVIKQDPNRLSVEKQENTKKGTSSISISSFDGGALSSDQEGISSSTMPGKETSVDITDESKQLSHRGSNKNIFSFSPSTGAITNQQQKYISSLVHFQEMTQKQGFSELILQDKSNSSRIKHFSTYEGKTGQLQQSPIIQSRTRNSLKKTFQPRRSVFVLNSMPLSPPSFLQQNFKNSTLAYLQCPTNENFQQSFQNAAYDEEDKKILHEIGFQIPNLMKALCGDTYAQLKHDLCQFCTDDIGSLAFSISQLIQSFCSSPVSHFISPFKLCQSLTDRVLDVLLKELKSLNVTQSSIDVFQRAFELHNSDILAESLEEKLGGLSQQQRIMSEVIEFCIQNSSNTLFEAKSKNELLDLHLKAIKRILKYNGDDHEGNEYRSEFIKTALNYSAVDVFESKKAFLHVFQKNALFYDKEFCFQFIEQMERTRYQMASGMSLYRLYFDENLKKSIREFILKLQCLMKNQKKEIFVSDLIDYVLSPKVTSSQIQKYGILSVDLLKECKQIFESHLRLEQEFTENLEYKLTFNYKFKKLEWILHDNPIKYIQGGLESLLRLFRELLVKEISKQNSQIDYSEMYQTGNFEFLIQLFFSSYDTFNIKDALFSFQSPVIEEQSTLLCWLQIFKQALLQKCAANQAVVISNLVEEMILSRFQLDSPRRRRTD